MNNRRIRAIRLAACAFSFGCALGAPAATFTVTNTDDSGSGSLRQAILDANSTPGTDIIQFAIPGSGVHTIATASPLAVTEAVTIDGYSQSGAAPNTDAVADNAVIRIELQGSGTDGLTITGGSTTVQGLALYGFQTAIALSTLADNLIQGNFIGINAAGTVTSGNVFGVTISGTGGLDRVGDSTPAARNVISGNSSAGVVVGSCDGKAIRGNLIGTSPNGLEAAANGNGVELRDSSNDQLGGPSPEDGNVISANAADGVLIYDGFTELVQRNRIGTDATGTAGLGNGGVGVRVEDFALFHNIFDNVISGNLGDGVSANYFVANPNIAQVIVGTNFIGTDASGTLPLGNGGAGVKSAEAPGLRVNGNTIAHNQVGIWETNPNAGETVTFSQNSIHSNHGLGIVLGGAGTIGPNAPGSVWNFPLITSVVTNGGTTTIQGTYDGRAGSPAHLEFFSNPSCAKDWPREFDEGTTFIGSADLSTDGSGHATFKVDLPVALTDETVTATALGVIFFLQNGGLIPTAHTSGFSQRLPFTTSPRSGDPAGGPTVTLGVTGTNFAAGAVVNVGGEPAAGTVVASSTQIYVHVPSFPPGTANDVEVVNTDGTHGTLPLGWIADFLDVPPSNAFHDFVVMLASNAVTGGIGGGNYGVANPVLRQQLAVFLLKAKHGICYVPPPCAGVFSDVPCPSLFADWIEALAGNDATSGCGAGLFCPQDPVHRDQMATFLLKAEHGSAYTPPACSGVFADVPCPSQFADWIEQLAAENITGGCGGGNYCPKSPNTRGQMAVFLVKTFGLP